MKMKSTKNKEGVRFIEASETYNLTHLSPFKEFSRGRLVHRDFNAHVFRWCHAAMILHKFPNREYSAVLDVGCGPDWSLLTTLHSNGAAPGYFVGVDGRDCSSTRPELKNTRVEFQQHDVTKTLPGPPEQPIQFDLNLGKDKEGNDQYKRITFNGWDMIVCFEVLEHMPKGSGLLLLDQLAKVMSQNTLLLFSTPVFDPKVGMADNHIYEWGYDELKGELESRFTLENHYGTFASMRDYTPLMNEAELKLMNKLKEYYNSALVANFMAPLYPHKSRNVLWHLRKKVSA